MRSGLCCVVGLIFLAIALPTFAQEVSDATGQVAAPSEPAFPVRIVETTEDAVRAQEELQREAQDLSAQQSMAQSTKVIVTVSQWQLAMSALAAVVAIVGTFALFISLRQTRTAILDTREIGEKQIRANLAFDDYAVEDCSNWGGPADVAITLVFKNSGASPARDICFDIVDSPELEWQDEGMEGQVLPPPKFRDFSEERVKGNTRRFCGAGSTVRSHWLRLHREAIAEGIRAKRFIYIAGWVRYKDDFWRTDSDYRYCKFCLIIQAPPGANDIRSFPPSRSTISVTEHGPDNFAI